MQTTRGSIEVSRLPSIGLDRMSSEQRELSDFLDEQGGLRGPFNPWVYCPALGEPAQRLGESLRFGGQLPGRVRELAILVLSAPGGRHDERRGRVRSAARWRTPAFGWRRRARRHAATLDR